MNTQRTGQPTAAQLNARSHRHGDGTFKAFDHHQSSQTLGAPANQFGTDALLDEANAILESLPGWTEARGYARSRIEREHLRLGDMCPNVRTDVLDRWLGDTQTTIAAALCVEHGGTSDDLGQVLFESGRTWLSDHKELAHLAASKSRSREPAADQTALASELASAIRARSGGGRYELAINAYAPHVHREDAEKIGYAMQDGHYSEVEAEALAAYLARDSRWGELIARSQDDFDKEFGSRITKDEGDRYWQGVEGDRSKLPRGQKGAAIRRDISTAQKNGWLPGKDDIKISSRQDRFSVTVTSGASHHSVVSTAQGYAARARTRNASEIMDRVRKIRLAYGHDRSDAAHDYFDSEYAGYGDFIHADDWRVTIGGAGR